MLSKHNGHSQINLINSLLDKNFTRDQINKHEIRCGSSAEFQGDERDIMFISMVDSVNEGDNSLRAMGVGTNESNKKRLNVAVSRAKDQLWIIYSFDPNQLKNDDLRKDLLKYCIDNQESEDINKNSESDFEKRIASNLISAGYSFKQQFKVAGYYLDFVVYDEKNRVAVECDGEEFHSSEEEIEKDLERQTILERIDNWKFIRIRGGEYYRDPTATFEKVKTQLSALDVHPYTGNITNNNLENSELLQRVKTEIVKLSDGQPEIVNDSDFEDFDIKIKKFCNSDSIQNNKEIDPHAKSADKTINVSDITLNSQKDSEYINNESFDSFEENPQFEQKEYDEPQIISEDTESPDHNLLSKNIDSKISPEDDQEFIPDHIHNIVPTQEETLLNEIPKENETPQSNDINAILDYCRKNGIETENNLDKKGALWIYISRHDMYILNRTLPLKKKMRWSTKKEAAWTH